jgi:hypothetical protein
MGHCEMLLAVAGLTDEQIAERTRALAEGDGSTFSSAERLAFRFAWKLTARPWDVGADDVRELVETFGRHRALDLVWHVAWGNYMTRVAEAFALPLERTNVFAPG